MSAFSATGSVNFTALTDGWSEPAGSAVNVRGFPGGDNIAISLGGQREVTRTIRCQFASRGDYVNFAIQRGKLGNLLIDNWDTGPVQAVLKSTNADPPELDGTVTARAEFVLA